MGLIMVSIGRLVGHICYLGDVCDFHKSTHSSLTGKTRLSAFADAAKKAFAPGALAMAA